ncbi:hypothetical protein EI77_03864 [Prosthecobacter fusiformis]|uniref:Uncharacterized protein n=2 Tax=Prosthecobacter fusiformis TaxID=48464 RepID=A0A4R7RPF3_9BACT|nr:hypothetical protein EI77_03864 [Prosthecobacter fusiformis]
MLTFLVCMVMLIILSLSDGIPAFAKLALSHQYSFAIFFLLGLQVSVVAVMTFNWVGGNDTFALE